MSLALAQGIPTTESRPPAGRLRPASLSEFAEQFDSLLMEKRDLACRLSAALDEIAAINQLYQERRAEFDSEKRLLNSEIDKLRAQVQEFSTKQEKKIADSGGVQYLLETRERLIREEFGRKFQDLTVEVKRQRTRYNQKVEEMEKQLSNCICQISGRGK